MTMYRDAHDVIRHVIEQRGRLFGYVGAGVSAEAQPPIRIADNVCADLHQRLLNAEGLQAGRDDDRIGALNRRLKWEDTGERYFRCIREALPNQHSRVNYFRELSEKSRPGFCHHGIALLMRDGVLKRSCLTTNFDKLLESAFTLQGGLEC